MSPVLLFAVSLDRAHLQLLRQRYYYATWKADGTRYMMLITREGCYLIDRKFTFRRVQLRFPRRGVQQGCFESHHLTLLDGEMIIDTVPETGEQKRRYLVYDLMMVNHQPKIKLPFHERWKLIDKEIIEPRTYDIKTNKYYRYDMEPFRVRKKDFWMLSAVGKVLNDFIPKLSHQADGLIFQGWDDPYIPHTHDGLLKWKYAHMNSVDFLFEIGEGNRQTMYLIDKGRNRKLEGAHVTFPDDQDPSNLSGKVIECSWNPKEQCWEFMRVRTDKPTPNGWHTYMKVMRSIEDNITQDIVLDEIAEIIRLPMYAERIKLETQALQHAARRR
uniref:mRNA guanylyltransferase n=1 Tax=Wollemia nobilis TaxID=56998 RepID=A0A0C9QXE7_9CONI